MRVNKRIACQVIDELYVFSPMVFEPRPAAEVLAPARRKPSRTMRIFSSAEYFLQVLRRMLRTVAPADAFFFMVDSSRWIGKHL